MNKKVYLINIKITQKIIKTLFQKMVEKYHITHCFNNLIFNSE